MKSISLSVGLVEGRQHHGTAWKSSGGIRRSTSRGSRAARRSGSRTGTPLARSASACQQALALATGVVRHTERRLGAVAQATAPGRRERAMLPDEGARRRVQEFFHARRRKIYIGQGHEADVGEVAEEQPQEGHRSPLRM